MTIDINEWRRLAQAATPGPWINYGRQPNAPGAPHSAVAAKTLLARVYSEAYGDVAQETANAAFIAAANPAAISEILDRLEAAESAWKESDKSCWDLTEKVIPNIREQLESAEKERDALRAKIEANESAQPAPDENDKSVRKAWVRFSNELHRSPDEPYPGMAEAFEHHFSQSFMDGEWRAESGTWAAAWKAAKRHSAQAQPAPIVPDDVIAQAVTRFLSWKLPKDFRPDGGMVFIPTRGRGYNSPHWPIGTNLFNAEQAREMLRYALAAAPEAKP